jgi:hypothetical protein
MPPLGHWLEALGAEVPALISLNEEPIRENSRRAALYFPIKVSDAL